MSNEEGGKDTVNLFGWKVGMTAFFIVLLSAVGLAAVVTYLSHTATTNVTVDSPVLLQVSEDGITWGTSINPSTWYGLDTRVFELQAMNNANNPTATVQMTTLITNNMNNVTCADFTAYVISDSISGVPLAGQSCTDSGDFSTATLKAQTQLNPGETKIYNVTLTLAIVQPATYHIATQVTTV